MACFSNGFPKIAAAAFGAFMVAGLSGCSGPEGSPVYGAVFGLENASVKPYRQGLIPAPAMTPGDRLVGAAANSPGQCIWVRAGSTRRFEADCPEGFAL